MRVSIETVLFAVKEYFDTEPETIFGRSRKREPVRMRQLFHYLAAKWTIKSLTDIGRYGGIYGTEQGHDTVIHSRRNIKNFLSINDREICDQVTDIESIILQHNYTGNEIIPHNINLLKMCK